VNSPGHRVNGSKGAAAASSAPQQDNNEEQLVSQTSRVAVQGTSDLRYLGASSGISFARVVFAAVKSSVTAAGERRGSSRDGNRAELNSSIRQTSITTGTSMRDSFFGLHTKPAIKPALFPSRELGQRLVNLYFQHCNPQFPILHRPEFMTMFERVYAAREQSCSPRESYLLNIVFAIGAGIIVGKPPGLERDTADDNESNSPESDEPPQKRRRLIHEQRQPEEYHASAIVHLEAVLNGSESSGQLSAELEELQAVLLLAGFALLRPVPPGLWYIIGVAVRLAIDLGLHAEDGGDNSSLGQSRKNSSKQADSKELGRRLYITDFRRRLWWCVYSFDRLVSSVVGRPFGFPDSFVTTGFPSVLDDQYITTTGIQSSPDSSQAPSYKHVAYHYFRLRLLHSEILSVLQHRQIQLAHERGITQDNPYLLTDQPCSFLKNFDGSFHRWRDDMNGRLDLWQNSAPKQEETGVQFSPLFLELNYWQTILMLYRQSLSVPADLAEDARSATDGVQSPVIVDDYGDVEQIFMKVATAGQKVLRLYRLLHRKYLVNYTYLSTHHLFMAGESMKYLSLYAVLY
jgi:transcription factor-like protein